MTIALDQCPGIALIDDDKHSARLMARALGANGAPAVIWYGNATVGRERLEREFNHACRLPSLVIVDLKAHSRATLEFIIDMRSFAAEAGITLAAVAPTLQAEDRQPYLAAGARAVFLRHGDRTAYRDEAASLVNFWARTQSLQPIGM